MESQHNSRPHPFDRHAFEPNPREGCFQMAGKNVGMRRQTPLRRLEAAINRPCPAQRFMSVRRSSGDCRMNCDCVGNIAI